MSSFRVVLPLGGLTRFEGMKKTSRRVSQEVVGITQSETRREAKRLRISSA